VEPSFHQLQHRHGGKASVDFMIHHVASQRGEPTGDKSSLGFNCTRIACVRWAHRTSSEHDR
jgi:hypothetical protein